MQSGKQRGAIPLIRRFNKHSERLLNSALCVLYNLSSFLFKLFLYRGDLPPAKKRRVDETTGTNVRAHLGLWVGDLVGYFKNYEAIDIEDLHDPDAAPIIALEMKDRERYFEGTASEGHINGVKDQSVR